MKLNWNFQKGGEVQSKKPSLGEEWMFSGTTHFYKTHEKSLYALYNNQKLKIQNNQ